MSNSIPQDWDTYNPCQKRDFYKTQITFLEQERNKYNSDSENWKETERKRIDTICKLAKIIDDALAYEQNHQTYSV